MDTLPTIAVVDELAVGGFRLINKNEFDASIHTEYVEPAPAKEPVKPTK